MVRSPRGINDTFTLFYQLLQLLYCNTKLIYGNFVFFIGFPTMYNKKMFIFAGRAVFMGTILGDIGVFDHFLFWLFWKTGGTKKTAINSAIVFI